MKIDQQQQKKDIKYSIVYIGYPSDFIYDEHLLLLCCYTPLLAAAEQQQPSSSREREKERDYYC